MSAAGCTEQWLAPSALFVAGVAFAYTSHCRGDDFLLNFNDRPPRTEHPHRIYIDS